MFWQQAGSAELQDAQSINGAACRGMHGLPSGGWSVIRKLLLMSGALFAIWVRPMVEAVQEVDTVWLGGTGCAFLSVCPPGDVLCPIFHSPGEPEVEPSEPVTLLRPHCC
jgi:hypothetical protein